MEEFIIRALLVGSFLGLASGPLGCFVLWRRLAYFGDTMAHSALLGIAIGLFFNVNVTVGVVMVCFLCALLLLGLQQQKKIPSDTLLGILSHLALALGIIVLKLMPNERTNIESILFGDLLTVNWIDVAVCAVMAGIALITLKIIWQPLLLISINESLAKAEGVKVTRYTLTFTFVIALLIAVAMKLVGVLLITAMLIMPAACARLLAKTPFSMALYAALVAISSVLLGLFMSYAFDTPSGPSIVVSCASLFALTLGVSYFINSIQKKSFHDI
ncbi:metal ABC transporter permease [Marinicellulosiphila megalodicopiae]|uniref:metal ABC transporter permease n=1 Tax=Marinicellulosiphila megalodicopiae TaxID=2724896 RepID=UPI003BAE77BD